MAGPKSPHSPSRMDSIIPMTVFNMAASAAKDTIQILSEIPLLQSLHASHPGSVFVQTFRPLQAQRIKELQDELQALVGARRLLDERLAHANPAIPAADGLGQELQFNRTQTDIKLHAYANALRDYETLSQGVVETNPDEPSLIRKIISWVFGSDEYGGQRDLAWQIERFNFRELNPEVRVERQRKKAFLERLWMGVFGGVALIAPMLLMVLHRGINTSIVTTSVATMLFTLVMAFRGSDWEGKDILAATATYAAVLVVFCWSESPGGGLDLVTLMACPWICGVMASACAFMTRMGRV